MVEEATKQQRGGVARTIGSALGIFGLVLAAQIAAPPINRLIYGDASSAAQGGSHATEVSPIEAAAQPDPRPAIYAPLDPAIIVSLQAADGSSHFLQFNVQAMARDQKVIDAVRNHAPALRNSFLLLISKRSFSDISTFEGKEELRAAMLEEARRILRSHTTSYQIEELYFTSFVVQ